MLRNFVAVFSVIRVGGKSRLRAYSWKLALPVRRMSEFKFDTKVLGRFLAFYLAANAFFLLAQLRSELLSEIFRLKHLPDFHLGAPVERSALQPLNCLIHRPNLPQPETSDQLF